MPQRLLVLVLVIGLLLPQAGVSYAQEGATQPGHPVDKRNSHQPLVRAAGATALSAGERQALLKPRSAQAQHAASKGQPMRLQSMSTRLPATDGAQAAAVQGWSELFAEDFDDMSEWTASVSSAWLPTTIDATWGATDFDADIDFNSFSSQSSWPASAGFDATTPDAGYPPSMDAWVTYGPIDLSSMTAAEVYFSIKYDMLPYTGFGFCARSGITDADDFDWYEDCAWLEDWENGINSDDAWEYIYLDLTKHVGESDLYIGFNFYNDVGLNIFAASGVFVDELTLWATDDADFDPVDPDDEFADWSDLYDEQFESFDPASSSEWRTISTGASGDWSRTENILTENFSMAAAVDGYDSGRRDWLIYGPVDLSNLQAADTDFLLNYNLTYNDDADVANDDWLGFCATASTKDLADLTPDDFPFYNCDWYWGASANNDWELAYHDLSTFVGESKVYLAWYFESNNDYAEGQALMDWVTIYGLPQSEQITVPSYNETGLQLVNGDFSAGLASWQTRGAGDVAIESGLVAFGETQTVAALTGSVELYQTFALPAEPTAININFTYAMSTTESTPQTDRLCVALSGQNVPAYLDLGCWDASRIPDSASDGSVSELFGKTLNAHDLRGLAGETMELIVELSQNDEAPTTAFVTNLVVYVMGEAPRPNNPVLAALLASTNDVATQRDNNEYNDSPDSATPISCGQTYEGVFGDVAPSTRPDIDYYRLTRVPQGPLVIDVDAQSLPTPSTADSVVELYDTDNGAFFPILLAENDDESETLYDSKLVYNSPHSEATYYLKFRNYNDDAPTNYYRFTVKCAAQVVIDPPLEPVNPPSPPSPPAEADNRKAWTVMLILNRDDRKCKDADQPNDCRYADGDGGYISTLEALVPIVAQKANFLNVVALVDGPEHMDTRAVFVTPNSLETHPIENVIPGAFNEFNLGDPDDISLFVRSAMNLFPARHYYLAIDGHGNGIHGISPDDDAGWGYPGADWLRPSELHTAFKSINHKIDIFGYEAPLMGMTENAYDIKDYVAYTYFWQPLSFVSQQYPAYLEELEATTTAEELVKTIVNRYPVTHSGYTMSAVDEAQMGNVGDKLNALAEALIEANVSKETLFSIRGETQNFLGKEGNYSTINGPAGDYAGYIDLWHFAQGLQIANLGTDEAEDLKIAIEQAVVRLRPFTKGARDNSNAHGLSIYFPEADSALEWYCQDYVLSQEASGWLRLLLQTFASDVDECDYAPRVTAAAGAQAGERLFNTPRMPVERPNVALAVTTAVVGQGAVTVDPPGPYTAGQQVTLTATPAEGWLFSDWSGDVISTTNPLSMSMGDDKSITATFVEESAASSDIFLPIVSR